MAFIVETNTVKMENLTTPFYVTTVSVNGVGVVSVGDTFEADAKGRAGVVASQYLPATYEKYIKEVLDAVKDGYFVTVGCLERLASACSIGREPSFYRGEDEEMGVKFLNIE